MIKKLGKFVGEYKKYALLTPVIMIGEVLMEVLIPLIMSKIIDNGVNVPDPKVGYVIKMGCVMILMACISLACGALGGLFASKAAMGFSKNLRAKLFEKVQDFSFANVDKFATSSLITRLTTDVNNVQNSFMMLIRSAVRSPMMLIGGTVMAFSINSKLAWVFLISIPILALCLSLIVVFAHPLFKIMLKKYDALNNSVQENLIGIRVVKAFVRERHEIEKFEVSADDVKKAQVKAEKIIILNGPIMQIMVFVCTVAVLWFGGKMVIAGSFEIGKLASFVTYITQILMSLMMLSMLFVMIIISIASAKRIVEVLDEEIDITDNDASEDVEAIDGSIEFKNVDFSYHKDPNKLNLQNINFRIESGETIGILGGTGSGKTSLVQLIPRLYDTLGGEVIVGGHNVKEYKLEKLRQYVGMVLQKNVLFTGTIKDNLLWGDEFASDEDIFEAAKNSQAHEFVLARPDGYETEIGQGGVNVSGGQKQRLCIARALVKKPKIIILDDSTSAVDTATDAKIRTALREQLGDTTAIIIAQRISSVMDADRIIVLDDGKIDDIGTHDELLARNQIYQEVYQSQQKGEDN